MAFTQADVQNMMHAFLPVIHQLIQENNKLIVDAMQTREKAASTADPIGGLPEWDSNQRKLIPRVANRDPGVVDEFRTAEPFSVWTLLKL